MRFYTRLIIIFSLILFSSYAFPQSVSYVSTTVLPNGMKVIVREGHQVNLVAVDIWVKAGSVSEASANNGISHLVEHMIFKATKKYGLGEIDRVIEGLGAELNGGTSKDWVHFYTTVASEYLPAALDVLAEAIMNPQFRAEDIDKERQVILDEIARAESDPPLLASGMFSKTVYKSHPYRLSPTGARDSVLKLTRDELVAYYNKYYTPSNICVAISGDISEHDAVAQVQRVFSGLQKAATAKVVPAAEPPIASPREERMQIPIPSNQAYVVLGYQAPAAQNLKEICALDVILAMMGDTYRGRIAGALNVNKVKFSKIVPDFAIQQYPSTISVLVTVESSDIDRTVAVLKKEFDKLSSETISVGELEQAKSAVEGSDLFEQETFSGQARTLGLYESVASYQHALNYVGTAASLTPTEVSAVAKKYLGSGKYYLLILEPEKSQ